MKNSVLIFYLLISTSFIHPPVKMAEIATTASASENLFVIITDGFRWQEVFNGADSLLINDETFTADTATLKSMYWADTKEERRKRLMPFFWNIIANKGQLIGNRDLKNKMNVANIYSVSYPGYNEIFTGYADPKIHTNKSIQNRNTNILEFLNDKPLFKDKVVAFTSWSIFPQILGTERNKLPVFA